MKKHLLTLAGITTLSVIPSSAGIILDITGEGTLVAGGGTAAEAQVGSVFLYTGLGGTSFDALVTINSFSTGATVIANDDGALLNLTGGTDEWVDFTLSFIEAGSSTGGNLLGNSRVLTGVTSFTAQDIDSEDFTRNNFTDVFGLYTTNALTLGSALENVGFENPTGLPSSDPDFAPTAGVDYVRATRFATTLAGDPDWRDTPNALTSDVNYYATWAYDSESVSEFRAIWGGTSAVNNTTLGNRGVLASLEYTAVAVPEPSSTALLGLGGLALVLRRRR